MTDLLRPQMAAVDNHTLPDVDDAFNVATFTHYTCIPSAIIILILAFLEKRTYKPDVFGGRPALIIPLPLLDGFENRFSFAAAFGAITNTILSLFSNLGDTFPFNFPLWAAALVLQVQVMEACLTCFPLFACIATRHRLVGAILGALYSSVLLGGIVTDCVQKFSLYPSSYKVIKAFVALGYLPMFMCYIYLISKSIHTVVVCVKTKSYVIKHQMKRIYPHQLQFTRLVLRKDYSPRLESTATEKLLYKKVPGFSYPVRVLAVAFILAVIVYRLTTGLLLSGVQATNYFGHAISSLNVTWTIGGITYYLVTPAAIHLLTGVWFIVTFISAALGSFYIYLFMKSYRRHILRMFRGDKNFILEKLPKPKYLMASNLRFPGYQIAYMLWGIFILFLVLFLTCSCLIYVVYFLSVNHFMKEAAISILQTLSVPLMALLLYYLQVFLAGRVLMQNKIKPSDEDPPLNVDNRRFYEIFNYYSLFGNLTIGIFSCFWRILQGSILGVFLVGRLDHSIYSRGWEHLDKGYLSYIAMLHVENTHNHPILRVFCDLLLETQESRGALLDTDSLRHVPRNNKARRRWHLAFTLLNNPALQCMRKSAHVTGSRRHRHVNQILQNEISHVNDWPISAGLYHPEVQDTENDCRDLTLNEHTSINSSLA